MIKMNIICWSALLTDVSSDPYKFVDSSREDVQNFFDCKIMLEGENIKLFFLNPDIEDEFRIKFSKYIKW